MSAASSARHCTACGSEVPPEARLCHVCGKPLTADPASATALTGAAQTQATAGTAAAGQAQAAAGETTPAEQAAGIALPVGIAPRGPWQDGTAIGMNSDAKAQQVQAQADDDSELDMSSLPPEVVLLLKSPPAAPDSGIMGSGLTWPRVIGCLVGMAVLAALALAMLWMLKAARQAAGKLDGQGGSYADRAEDSPEAPPADVDATAPDEPAPVQGLQGGSRESGSEDGGADSAGSGEGAGAESGGDTLF